MERLITLRNQTSLARVPPEYLPLLGDVTALLQAALGPTLREVRVLGSVARGNAVPGSSDLDVLAVTLEDVPEDVRRDLDKRTRALAAQYPLVTKVDLQMMSDGAIAAHPEYELIVRTDSFCLTGEDRYTTGEVTLPVAQLADLWHPDIDGILRDYETALRNPTLPADEVVRYTRLTGKDMLKCFQRRRLLEHGIYERDMEFVYEALRRHLPGDAPLFDRLWAMYCHPTAGRDAAIAVLEACREAKARILTE